MSVHTSVLVRKQYNVATAGSLLFQVDTGSTWIIKDIEVSVSAGAAGLITVQIWDNIGFVKCVVLSATIGAGQQARFAGFIAVADTDQVVFTQVAGLTVNYWVTGAKLIGVV